MNTHIIEYLDYYTQLKISPNFAVMLRGNWGSGKTWLINKYIGENEDKKFLTVSLYGVSSVSEIDESLFQQLHPVLGSKKMKLAGKILKGLLKTTVNIDLNGDGKKDVTQGINIPDVNLPSYLNKLDDKILVFDDLERCSIPVKSILGYINQYVENLGLKVIILANETEIIKADNKIDNRDNASAYITIKEKLIGKSFDVNTNAQMALASFIEELGDEEIRKVLKEKASLIIDLFDTSNYQNLRHLRQAILDFERFYTMLPISVLSKSDALEHIISLFFIISFEIKKGDIEDSDIPKLFYLHAFRTIKSEQIDKVQPIRKKYTLLDKATNPILPDLWKCYFENGTIDKDKLQESIEKSWYYKDESTPEWVKLWHLYDLDDSEFLSLFNTVKKKFEKNEIDNLGELMHVTCMFNLYSEQGFIKLNKEKIIETAKKGLKCLMRNGLLNHIQIDNYRFGEAYAGLGFHGLELQENKSFIKKVKEQVTNAQLVDHPNLAKALLRDLSTDTEKFRQQISYKGSSHVKQFDTPILSFVKPQHFVNSYLKLRNKEKHVVREALFERYDHDGFNLKLKLEKDWLEKVHTTLDGQKAKYKGKISEVHIDELLKTISNGISRLKNIS